MSNEASIGKGTLFKREDAVGGGAFTTIARLNNVTHPRAANEFDGTSMESTTVEPVKDMVDNQTLNLELHFVPGETSQKSLEDDFNDEDHTTGRKYRLVYNDTANTYREFTGYVASFETGHPVRGLQTATVGIRVVGDITEGTGG
jgi:hypothetical protein